MKGVFAMNRNEESKNIIRLHKVEGFDPGKYTIDIKPAFNGVQQGGKYLPVHARIMWFKLDHPDGTIRTEIISVPNESRKLYIVKATIADNLTQPPIATAYGSHEATADKKADPFGTKALECAETEAVGRALLFAGYGTLMAGSDLAEDGLSDAPVQPSKSMDPEARINEILKSMTKDMALGTIVPCGVYKGKTFKELLMKKKKSEVLYFAHDYKATHESDFAIIAASRMIEDGYRQKLAAKKNTEPAA
jgi:hypothetical protein